MNQRIPQVSIIQAAIVGDNSVSAKALTNFYQTVAQSNSFVVKIGDIIRINARGRIYNHSGATRSFGHSIVFSGATTNLEPATTLATGLTSLVRLEAEVSVFSIAKSNVQIKVTSTLSAPEDSNSAYTDRVTWNKITAGDGTNGGLAQILQYQVHDGAGSSGCDFYLDYFHVEQIRGALVQ